MMARSLCVVAAAAYLTLAIVQVFPGGFAARIESPRKR